MIVSLFLRGGADGLTLCPPHGDKAYSNLRATLAVAPPDAKGKDKAIDLDGQFGLAPALKPLKEIYKSGDLLIVHACGLPNGSRDGRSPG